MPLAPNPSYFKLVPPRAWDRFQDEQASDHVGMIIGEVKSYCATPVMAAKPNTAVSHAFDELIYVRSQRSLIISGKWAFAITQAPQIWRYNRETLRDGWNNFPPLIRRLWPTVQKNQGIP